MVQTSDIKFYKSSATNVAGDKFLGGSIDTSEIISGNPNNFFGNASYTNTQIGNDRYQCLYIKNTHTSEKVELVSFWLDVQSGSPYADTTTQWARDPAGINATAQTIPNASTRPVNVSWNNIASGDPGVNIGTLLPGQYCAIWIWRTIKPGAVSRLNDGPLFAFAFTIPSEGSGSGGGIGGGTLVDKFGLKMFFQTKSGGEEWYSDSWANGHSRDLTATANPAGMWDPDEVEKVGVARINNIIFRINGDGTATCGPGNSVTSGETCRIFIKRGPSAGWCNTELTMAVRVRVKTQSIQMRTRANHHGVLDLPYGYDNTHDTSCGFGNYMVKFGNDGTPPDITQCWNQVEVIQDLYGPHDGGNKSWPGYTLNVWQGYKTITRTIGNTVNVQGWFCADLNNQDTGWVKYTEFTYNGTNCIVDQTTGVRPADIQRCLDADGSTFGGDQIAGDINKNTLWLNPSYWNWIRIDETVQDVDLKWVSVREIQGDSSTGGGGTGGNPPPPTATWRMAIAGDWGCGSVTKKVHDLAKQYDFILGVGDNAYSSAGCWTDTFSDVKSKMHSAFGNHEYEESGGIGPYKTFFGYDKTYFSFDFQNAHIIVIDSNINMDQGSAQHTFVENDLAAYDNNPNTDWLFATWHHPMFTADSNHSPNYKNSVQAFHKLLMDHKCALVFSGHNHNWQMTKQVAYNSGSPTNPTIVNATSPFTVTTQGLISVISGAGGHDSGSSLYDLNSNPGFNYYQNTHSHNGIFELVASNNGKTLTCSFVDTDGSKYNTIVINTP